MQCLLLKDEGASEENLYLLILHDLFIGSGSETLSLLGTLELS